MPAFSRYLLLATCALLCAAVMAGPADARRAKKRSCYSELRAKKVPKQKAKKRCAKVRRRVPQRPSVSSATTVAAPSVPAVCTNTADLPTVATVVAAQAATLCLLNQERARRGLVPLALNAQLGAVATAHSQDMVTRKFFDHTAPGGSTVVSRIQASGYIVPGRSWQVGENIAWGTGRIGTPAAIMQSWMNSPPHRHNILEPRFREIGVGIAAGTPSAGLSFAGATYTTEFGTRG